MKPQDPRTSAETNFSASIPEQISIRDGYILIQPKTVEYFEIYSLSAAVLSMPEFKNKHTILWLKGDLGQFNMPQLSQLNDFIDGYFPNEKFTHKTAFVAETGFLRSVAETYASIPSSLPIERRVFSSLEDAEAWIRS